MTGLGQQSRVLLHHKRHPKPRHGGQGIGGRARVGGGRMSLSRARTRAHMQTRARARAGEYHLALGPPTRDATRATKASMQTRASVLKARAGVYFLAMQTRASPWRARAWGIHVGRWPSETGRQGKHADKGKLVEGEGKGGEPEHSFNALAGSNDCGTLPGQIRFDHWSLGSTDLPASLHTVVGSIII
jgi:hypothetical protein